MARSPLRTAMRTREKRPMCTGLPALTQDRTLRKQNPLARISHTFFVAPTSKSAAYLPPVCTQSTSGRTAWRRQVFRPTGRDKPARHPLPRCCAPNILKPRRFGTRPACRDSRGAGRRRSRFVPRCGMCHNEFVASAPQVCGISGSGLFFCSAKLQWRRNSWVGITFNKPNQMLLMLMQNVSQLQRWHWVRLVVAGVLVLFPSASIPGHAQTNEVILPQIVTIRATDPIARETGMLTVIDPGVFTVHRTGPTNVELTVYYSITGTASNGVDYIRLSGAVVIPAGVCEAEITVYPISDGLLEGVETVVVKLRPVMCIDIYPPPPDCYVVGEPSEATVYILDFEHGNQPPLIRITSPASGEAFSAQADINIQAEATDFDGCVTNVIFLANGRAIGTIAHACNRPDPTQPVTFEIRWTNAPAGHHKLTALAADNLGACSTSAPVCILVYPPDQLPTNLPPIVSIVAIDPVAAEGTNCFAWPRFMPCLSLDRCGLRWVTNSVRPNTATFIVRRTGPTNDALTVFYRVGGTASNGVDYIALPGSVTIQPGRRCAQVEIVPIDDALAEPIETVIVQLIPSLLDVYPPPYYTGRRNQAAAIIADNDRPRPTTCTLPDRCFHVCWPATNGQWFRIECSSDLVNWAPVATNIVTEGAVHFVDPDSDAGTAKFYRAIPETNPPEPVWLIE